MDDFRIVISDFQIYFRFQIYEEKGFPSAI